MLLQQTVRGRRSISKNTAKVTPPAGECRAEGDKKAPHWMQVVTTRACLPACSKSPLDDSGCFAQRQHQ